MFIFAFYCIKMSVALGELWAWPRRKGPLEQGRGDGSSENEEAINCFPPLLMEEEIMGEVE